MTAGADDRGPPIPTGVQRALARARSDAAFAEALATRGAAAAEEAGIALVASEVAMLDAASPPVRRAMIASQPVDAGKPPGPQPPPVQGIRPDLPTPVPLGIRPDLPVGPPAGVRPDVPPPRPGPGTESFGLRPDEPPRRADVLEVSMGIRPDEVPPRPDHHMPVAGVMADVPGARRRSRRLWVLLACAAGLLGVAAILWAAIR